MTQWAEQVRLRAYVCEMPARGAVVICPGGGYEWRSPRESEPVARAFRAIGLHAFVLEYDCAPAPLGSGPLRQLSRAVRAVRAHSDALGIPQNRIAVCGFSAGGHLAASLAVLHGDKTLFEPDTDLRLHRPDALIACYPVITCGEGAHAASFERLAGPDPAAQRAWSLETRVTPDTPPVFMWHTADDESVSCRNSLCFAGALLRAGVPVELHLYPHGVHGLSLATPEVDEPEKGRLSDPHVAGWFAQMDGWLAAAWGA